MHTFSWAHGQGQVACGSTLWMSIECHLGWCTPKLIRPKREHHNRQVHQVTLFQVRITIATAPPLLYIVLCYVTLCYNYVMLCYVMLCYAMLCYAMLYYVMLCTLQQCYITYVPTPLYTGCSREVVTSNVSLASTFPEGRYHFPLASLGLASWINKISPVPVGLTKTALTM